MGRVLERSRRVGPLCPNVLRPLAPAVGISGNASSSRLSQVRRYRVQEEMKSKGRQPSAGHICGACVRLYCIGGDSKRKRRGTVIGRPFW
ncbi:hypothetical protein NDU88_002144 [Pleurodeles waltl]|uniref:Uncharacterized protein n=1 Tax=Pleurodeles waltl TaxID=8319 RepID=A0AAV7T1K9_PLEWA|nr:hypothetical protein NDU88_002144 [Pleurodeles waltl]